MPVMSCWQNLEARGKKFIFAFQYALAILAFIALFQLLHPLQCRMHNDIAQVKIVEAAVARIYRKAE